MSRVSCAFPAAFFSPLFLPSAAATCRITSSPRPHLRSTPRCVQVQGCWQTVSLSLCYLNARAHTRTHITAWLQRRRFLLCESVSTPRAGITPSLSTRRGRPAVRGEVGRRAHVHAQPRGRAHTRQVKNRPIPMCARRMTCTFFFSSPGLKTQMRTFFFLLSSSDIRTQKSRRMINS